MPATFTTTYYARPAQNGGFTLTSDQAFTGRIKTLNFARSYAEFAGAILIVLDKDGNREN